MRTRFPSPADRARLIEIISQGGAFRPEEVSCAIELLDGALGRAEDNTYEALVAVDEADLPVGYTCFGATPMTQSTFDLYWMVIAAEARGQGLGGALAARTQEDPRRIGARPTRAE